MGDKVYKIKFTIIMINSKWEHPKYFFCILIVIQIASLSTTWNMSNVFKWMIYALRTGWCALKSVDTEIKHSDN